MLVCLLCYLRWAVISFQWLVSNDEGDISTVVRRNQGPFDLEICKGAVSAAHRRSLRCKMWPISQRGDVFRERGLVLQDSVPGEGVGDPAGARACCGGYV